jgi:hypothetical protein
MGFIGQLAILSFLPALSMSTCEYLTYQTNNERIKRSSVDDSSYPACLVVEQGVFVDISAGLEFWSFGGAICLELPGSTGNRISNCLFDECYVSMLTKTDYGGAFAVMAASVTIERCCGRDCSAQRGQFFWVEGGSDCGVSEVAAISCATTSADDPLYGALDFAEPVSPTLLNVNLTQ